MKKSRRSRPARRPQPGVEVRLPMSSMVDIVFLLLVFFAWTYQPPAALAELPVFGPQFEGSGEPSLRIGIYTHGFTMNDRQVSDEKLEDMLFRMADLDPNQTLVVLNTPNAPHRQTIKLLDICHHAGLTRISLLSTR